MLIQINVEMPPITPQVLMPRGCPRVSAVTMRLLGNGEQHKAAPLHSLDLAFGDAKSLILSITNLRHTRFRPVIGTG